MLTYIGECLDGFCRSFNSFFAIPSTILFFVVAVFLTIKTGFVQFRGFPRFIRILLGKTDEHPERSQSKKSTISSYHALFAAMASTIGMGNVVGPSVAIMIGGPGALFWLLIYIFFGSATKFAEVTFAVATRRETPRGLIGGPMEYLSALSPYLALWYSTIMIFLFMSWSSLQSNTLAAVLQLESISPVYVGVVLAAIALFVVTGGAQRVGDVASKLVPLMFVLYVSFALFIILSNPTTLVIALKQVFHYAFAKSAPFGAFLGAGVMQAMQQGIYRSIFITEAGLGTSSIPHSMADVKHPVDQGLLALFSMASDALLATLSGLIVLVTGVWQTGIFRSTLIYEAFAINAPWYGKYVLLVSIGLFVVTTVIGNTFNGMQSLSSFASLRVVRIYIRITGLVIFAGALLPVQSMWNIMDVLLTLAAIPNVIGLVILALKYPKTLSLSKK